MMRQPPSEAQHFEVRGDVSPRRHIAIIIAALGAGGAERVISLISEHWASSGHRVTVIAFDRQGDAVFHPLDPRIRIIRLGIEAGQGGWAAALNAIWQRCLRLRRTLEELRPDVTISFLTKINVLTLLASLGRSRRVIVSERNNPRLQRASRAWTFVLKWLHWRADATVMQTRASLECISKRARRRAVVIPNPIAITPRERPKTGNFILAATGRLTWQKGFDLLLDAFALIAARHSSWRLVIRGEGEEREALERQIRERGLTALVSMPGNSLSPAAWVEQADAFVLSSRYEGFSNALGEAMAAGLPVVAFDCAYSPSEMIRHDENGLLVANGDVAALAAALDRLLGDAELRSRLGHAARETGERFHPAVILSQWETLITRITA